MPEPPVTQPPAVAGITLHILRADGQPFAPGGQHAGAIMRICPVVSCPDQGSGPGVVFPLADENGDVVVPALDPDAQYSFMPMAQNVPDWNCPDYTDLGPPLINYWFGPLREPFKYDVIGTPADLDNTTFYIAECE